MISNKGDLIVTVKLRRALEGSTQVEKNLAVTAWENNLVPTLQTLIDIWSLFRVTINHLHDQLPNFVFFGDSLS